MTGKPKPPRTTVGQKFGQWIVTDPGPIYSNGSPNRKVGCVCSCGEIGLPVEASLLDGRSVRCKLCKQLRHGSTLVKENTGWRVHMYKYVYGAERRGIDWNLDVETFMALCQRNCDYCNAEPVERVMNHHVIKTNGIDRVDSSRDYSESNCVPCCGRCNKMKMDMSREDFLSHIQQISRFGLKT